MAIRLKRAIARCRCAGCRHPFGPVIIAGMTPHGQKPDVLHRCEGGPLHRELHDEGEAFEFDGRSLGMPSGVYRRVGGIYVWEPAGPETLEPHEPTADE